MHVTHKPRCRVLLETMHMTYQDKNQGISCLGIQLLMCVAIVSLCTGIEATKQYHAELVFLVTYLSLRRNL